MSLYTIFELVGCGLIQLASSAVGTLSCMQERYAGRFIIEDADLPADFSTDTYTIADGELVRLPAEVIAEREAAALRASEQAAAVTEIARLKEYLAATDWAVVKCLEIGAPLAEIYPELHAERIEARASINTLEEQTKTTAQ